MRFSDLSPRFCVVMLCRLGMRQADIARTVQIHPTTVSRLTAHDVDVSYTTADKLRALLEGRVTDVRLALRDLDNEFNGDAK